MTADVRLDWEEIPNNKENEASYRTKVGGGWIVRVDKEIMKENDPLAGDTTLVASGNFQSSMVFIPDPYYNWK